MEGSAFGQEWDTVRYKSLSPLFFLPRLPVCIWGGDSICEIIVIVASLRHFGTVTRANRHIATHLGGSSGNFSDQPKLCNSNEPDGLKTSCEATTVTSNIQSIGILPAATDPGEASGRGNMFSSAPLHNIPEHTALAKLQQPPPVDSNPETEALFAAELAKLSMQERDEMLQDIHGVSDVQQENPAYIQRCFEDMENAISKIPAPDKMAYTQARDLDESYVKNDDFMLMFLRALSFNVKAAAARMVAFFQLKLELFGPSKLAKEILYDDLDTDDIECLESGYAQILSGRDRAGRVILVVMPIIRKYRNLKNRMRASFLVLMHALRDIETQQKGIVGVAYNVGVGYTQDRLATWTLAKLVGDMPVKFKGMHYCYDNEKVKMLFSLAMFVWERQTRIRCRLHGGSDMECVYNLMTFGIPADILPITPSGDLRLEAHQDYCKKLKKYAGVNGPVDRLVVPGTYDVLLGRGKPLQKHPGNLRYHHSIESFHSRYEEAQKLEKTNLSRLIVQMMKDEGSRFLKQDELGWIEIDDDAARYKVSHTFRNHRIAARVMKKKTKAAPAYNRRKHDDGSDASSSEDAAAPLVVESAHDIVEGQKRRRLSGISSTVSVPI